MADWKKCSVLSALEGKVQSAGTVKISYQFTGMIFFLSTKHEKLFTLQISPKHIYQFLVRIIRTRWRIVSVIKSEGIFMV